jgi:hypothetical protein
VGYAPVSNMELLPKIKPSVLATTGKASHVSHNEVAIQKINFLYAKEYSIEKDLGIVIRSLKQLGN